MEGELRAGPRVVADGARELLTPEGVAVRFHLASLFERGIAFGVDVMLVMGASLAVALLGWMASSGRSGGWFSGLMLLILFVFRNFYFMGWELLWRGQTPGKRLMRLRVVDRRGGVLMPSALCVRNVTRDMEIFLPVTLLSAMIAYWDGVHWLLKLCLFVWTGVFALMPWLNRDRLRVGDLAAGTMVVKEPYVTLWEEVTAQGRGVARARFVFTEEQLDMYGIYEMQVLEDFLRQYPNQDALEGVAEKIAHKIAWSGSPWAMDVRQFLEDYYEALRARREQRLLFGDRQETKREGSLSDQAPKV